MRIALPVITLIAAVTLVPTRGAAQGARRVSATLETGHPIHVVVPGDEKRLALAVTNTAAQPTEVTAHIRVESFDGGVVSERAALHLPAAGSQRWPFPASLLGKPGIKWVEYRLVSGGEETPLRRESFVYMQPSGPTTDRSGGFLFGIAYGAGPDNRSETAALAAGLIGVKIARAHPAWGTVQPTADVWNWDEPDRILAVHARQGIEVQFLLSGTPRWAGVRPPGPGQRPAEIPPRLDAWRAWVSAAARRYHDRVRFWEIWNEPDIGFFAGTTPEYMDMLRVAHEEIKKVDPALQVMTGGFASMNHRGSKPGMLETVLRDGQPFFDRLAYHRHGVFPEFRHEIDDQLLPLRMKAGAESKPIYFTETAMDTRFGERHQAQTLVKKVAFAWSRGATAYTWFNLHDMERAQSPRQPGFTYGLLTKEGYPKAAYPAYNALTALLRGKRFVRQFPSKENCWAFLFADAREQVVVAWNETPLESGAQLSLTTDASTVRVADLMGNESSAPTEAGRTLLTLGDAPQYLRLIGAREEPQVTVTPLAPAVTEAIAIAPHAFPATPAFVLERPEQVVNLAEDDPHTRHLLWKSPADLSAKVWLAHDGKALRVRVAVTDDVYRLAQSRPLWEGDSVQIGLRIPGQDGPWLLGFVDGGDAPRFEAFRAPAGRTMPADKIALQVQRQGAGRTYEITLPDAVLGLTDAALVQGVRLNLLVNDNDGQGRKGWLELAPGLGRRLAPDTFPLAVLRKE